MKINVKKVSFNPPRNARHSTSFTGLLYIKGIHVGHCNNHGYGSPTYYYPVSTEGERLIRQAENFYEKRSAAGKQPGSLLEAIDDRIARCYRKKVDRQNLALESRQEVNILYGKPGELYSCVPLSLPLADLAALPPAWYILAKILRDRVLPNMADGDKILNTNIPEPILMKAGCRPDQYTPVIQLPPPEINKENKHRGHRP